MGSATTSSTMCAPRCKRPRFVEHLRSGPAASPTGGYSIPCTSLCNASAARAPRCLSWDVVPHTCAMRVHSCSHGCRLLCISPYVSAHCSDLLPLQAKERMTKSTVVDSATGKSMDSDVRTSTGSFYSRGQDEVRQSWVDECWMFGWMFEWWTARGAGGRSACRNLCLPATLEPGSHARCWLQRVTCSYVDVSGFKYTVLAAGMVSPTRCCQHRTGALAVSGS